MKGNYRYDNGDCEIFATIATQIGKGLGRRGAPLMWTVSPLGGAVIVENGM